MPGTEEALAERVRSLADPVLARYEAELVDIIVRRGRTQLVRLIVDAEGGIDLDTCARVSDEVSRLLDADDPIPGRYTLEVSSPGVSRPLRGPVDFRKNLGRKIRVILADRQVEGTVEEVEEDRVRLATAADGEWVAIAAIAKATIVLPW